MQRCCCQGWSITIDIYVYMNASPGNYELSISSTTNTGRSHAVFILHISWRVVQTFRGTYTPTLAAHHSRVTFSPHRGFPGNILELIRHWGQWPSGLRTPALHNNDGDGRSVARSRRSARNAARAAPVRPPWPGYDGVRPPD